MIYCKAEGLSARYHAILLILLCCSAALRSNPRLTLRIELLIGCAAAAGLQGKIDPPVPPAADFHFYFEGR